MKILVHICCAPDALYFLKKLREDNPYTHLVGFFYDPNIHPYEEYKLRFIETERMCKSLGIELYEGEYDVENWMLSVKGYEDEPERGKRCKVCFDYRLERSAKFAKEIGATHITTTLLMSPKKEFNMLKESGYRIASMYGLEFLCPDYRKGGGTQEMFRMSKQLEFYHQDYCGCIYGLFKQKREDAVKDLVSLGGRRPGSKEETLFIKSVRLFAEQRNLPCKEWEFSFLNWKLLHGRLQIGEITLPSLVSAFSRSIRGILKADVEELVGNIVYYNKGGLKVILVDELKDEPVKQICGLTDPTFKVPFSYKEALLKERIKAELQTEFSSDVSRILLVGSLEASTFISVPADTLQDSRGISLETLEKFITQNLSDITRGKLTLVVCGAESLGKAGSNYFTQRTGKITEQLSYDFCL